MRDPRYLGLQLLTLLANSAHAGWLVANNDEWTFSNHGYSQSPDADNFINNVTNLFTGDQSGNFLAYSSNFGLTGSTLRQSVEDAGHTWTVTTSVTFDLPTLESYDGIFLGGNYVNQQTVIDYLDQGGNVYIMAGTGWGGSVTEANSWNQVLAEAGLQYSPTYNGIGGITTPDDPSHALLQGVSDLFFDNGNTVLDLNSAGTNGEILFSLNGQGMLALGHFGDLPPDSVYSPVPTPATVLLFLVGLLAVRKRKSH